MHVHHSPEEKMAAGCAMRRKQVKRGNALDSVMLGTLGLGIHVNVTWTRTTYVKMVADHIQYTPT